MLPPLSRRSLLTGAAALVLSAGPLSTSARGAAGKTPKVLVIGLDGALLSRVAAADAPNLKALMAAGLTATSSIYAAPLAPTLSGPGWSTILTGVWPDKHHVTDNAFTGQDFARYPDFLTRIETARPALTTYAVASWAPITDTVLSAAVDTRVSTPSEEYDAGTTVRLVEQLRNGDPDAAFVQLDGVDEAGHAYGAASQQYLDAIHVVDTQVGQFVAAVRGRPRYSAEDWLIMVTADHGHTNAGGHGGSSLQERQTFLVATGPTITGGSTRHDVKMPDIAASVLAHLGIQILAAWGLDGRPLQQPRPDDFAALRGALRTRADETGIAPAIVGWTHTPPAGWSVDNSLMGTGGVTEWRGWSFATDEFWTSAEADQQREANVRARDVFAVADGDEWSDEPVSGTFDSTLTSRTFPVTGGATAVLTYTTFYRQESPQQGEVLVSFDGAAPVPVRTYTADVPSREEAISLEVPLGATGVRVLFHYTGGNNWYWTVSQVAVGDAGPLGPAGPPPVCRFVNRQSGKVIDVPAGSTATGTALIQYAPNDGDNQRWQVTAAATDVWEFTNVNSGLAMDVQGGSTAAGAPVIQWTPTHATNQQWRLADAGAGHVKIVSARSGLVLGISDGSTADGAAVRQQTDTGSAAQHWRVQAS
ncbi:RICIN domain-containing protein [Streptomyces sp. NPDC020917]|uniref:RICIN domain-containing protein n=1 Tax=Streptomyces sp. NPDC020917 TaxID=3365102 RepID=UPI0037968F55